LGEDPSDAKVHLYELERRNIRRYDFDKDKIRPEPIGEPERLTVAGYAPEFLRGKSENRSPAVKVNVGHLVRLFKDTPLEEIDRDRIKQYREWRRGETVTKRGIPVKSGAKIKDSTINKEINSLMDMLKTSAEKTNAKVPSSKQLIISEKGNQRDRILDEEEYKALLNEAPRWLQRILVFANESALSQGDLLKLTWAEVHRKRPQAAVIKVKGGRKKNGEKQVVPISPALHAVLDELEEERGNVISIDGNTLVFTLHGKRIKRDQLKKPFNRAREKAKVNGFVFHDYRRCCATRWMLGGISDYLRKRAMGHSTGSVHEGYLAPPDEMTYKHFADHLGWNGQEVDKNIAAK